MAEAKKLVSAAGSLASEAHPGPPNWATKSSNLVLGMVASAGDDSYDGY